MRIVSAAILAALAFVCPISGFAAPDVSTPENNRTEAVKVPDNVGTDGAFSYNIDIKVPEFRGLEPRLSLNYNSQARAPRAYDPTLGIGWSLGGVSMIERVSLGGGTPYYDDATQDIFQLDGMELLACADPAAVANGTVYAGAYPDEYKTNRESASCTAGGDFVTLRDNYLKITRTGNDNDLNSRFYVYRTDGTRLTYTSVGQLSGETGTPTNPWFGPAFQRKWLLTEVRDTQEIANVVSYTYSISPRSLGYAVQLARVDYAGYSVRFYYGNSSYGDIKFATGSPYFETYSRSLNTIGVFDGTTKIRAYSLGYETTELTKRLRLETVTEYGSDFALSGSEVGSGSSLPAWAFDYEAEALAFRKQVLSPSGNVHTAVSIGDYDGDQRDELLFNSYSYTDRYGLRYSLSRSRFSFDQNGAPQHHPDDGGPHLFASSDGQGYASSRGSLGAYRVSDHANYPSLDSFFPYPARIGRASGTVGNDRREYLILSPSSNSSAFTWSGSFASSCAYFFGNFDRDFDTEIVRASPINNYSNTFDFNGNSYFDTRKRNDLEDLCEPSGGGSPASINYTTHASSIDINGDGKEEILHKSKIFELRIGGNWEKRSVANSPWGWDFGDKENHDIRFGDVNGDGLADGVLHDRNDDKICVFLSTGEGFLPPDCSWGSLLPPEELDLKRDKDGIRSAVVDVNGDGLADYIAHAGFKNRDAHEPQIASTARLFLSNGKKFIRTHSGGGYQIGRFLGVGDFDGDGQMDLVSQGSSTGPGVFFDDTAFPNLMTSVHSPSNSTSEIEYWPTTRFANNDIPGVSQVVRKVTNRNGLGLAWQDRTTTFDYVNGKYDFDLRKSLGFGTVTATLPKLWNEVTSPTLVTTYQNDRWATRGRVKSQTLIYDGQTQRQTINDWALNPGWTGAADDARPFRAIKSKAREKTRWGANLVEKTTDYTYSIYNKPVKIFERGLGGTSGANADDVTTYFGYQSNPTKFIVKPVRKIVVQGSDLDWGNRANWLLSEYYSYDGKGSPWEIPTIGNLTKVELWNGNLSNDARRVETQTGYDDRGNVTWKQNGRGSGTRTSFSYDTAKNLFPVTEINALGHQTTTVWNAACQIPSAITDANGLVTSFSHDAFCREYRKDYPNGQLQRTFYRNLGTAAQNIRTETRSASTVDGKKWHRVDRYFNGFGEVHREARSGNSDNDFIVTLRNFNQRGDLGWESIPGTWSYYGAFTDLPAGERTSLKYDPLGRAIRTTHPDGTYVQTTFTSYQRSHSGQTAIFPQVNTFGEDCHDNDASTVCDEVSSAKDAFGRTIIMFWPDRLVTDVDATNVWRVGRYFWDGLGRLTRVVDPGGKIWSYTYNAFGDRIVANDPGLGNWTMEYDAAHNLTRQTDAKGQVIDFVYDALNRQTLKKVTGANVDRHDIRYNYDWNRAGFYNKGKLVQSVAWTAEDGDYHVIDQDYNSAGLVAKEQHRIDGTNGPTYTMENHYRLTGDVVRMKLPYNPGGTAVKWSGDFQYDAASRVTGFGPYVTSVAYNLWDQPTQIDYGSSATNTYAYHPKRGWVTRIDTFGNNTSGVRARLAFTEYTRTASGRVARQNTQRPTGRYDYQYDYIGRLLSATNWSGQAHLDQSFTYDRSGSMRSNSQVGTYAYHSNKLAPHSITHNGQTQTLTYDANGNMTYGLDGKVMTYDGENRPLSVTYQGVTTSYVYGADGKRLKRIDDAGTGQQSVTVYFGPVEIRNFGEGQNEVILTYLHPDVRTEHTRPGGVLTEKVSYLHRDQLQSVRLITGADAQRDSRPTYKPFGVKVNQTFDVAAQPEDKGFIGERYDAGAGLQYLNARYYDPELGLFLQPDWFEVTEPGVGTNRYAYSFNDPVNLRDPEGNNATDSEAKTVSEHSYGDVDDEELPEHIVPLSEAEMSELSSGVAWTDNSTGFRARAYKNTKTGAIVVGFAGTVDVVDWMNNGLQIAGAFAPQYNQASELAIAVSKNIQATGGKLSFAGHSLGGGLAMTAAISMEVDSFRNAKTFNAAGLNFITRLRYGGFAGAFSATDQMTNHAVVTDPLTQLNHARIGVSVPGKNTYHVAPMKSLNPVDHHIMRIFDGIIK